MRTFPVSIGYYSGGTGTLYYDTHGFTTPPSASPGNTTWAARVRQPANLRRDLFGAGTTLGRTTARYGDLILANPRGFDGTGPLDGLFSYAFDSRTLTQYLREDTVTNPASFTTLLVATMEEAEFSETEVRFKLRERLGEFDKPVQTTLYAGTGALEGGSELKGKPKPMLFGYRTQIRPVLVDAAKLIYQVSAIGTVSMNTGGADVVWEGGVAIPPDATPTYADETALNATAPAAGTFRYLPAGGYIRLGSSPTRVITCSASTSYDTVGGMWAYLMTLSGASNLDSGVEARLDAANAGVIGLWVGTDEQPSYSELIDRGMNTIGGWWTETRTGQMTAGVLYDPSTQTATYTFRQAMMDQFARISVRDAFGGLPTWRVRMRWGYREPFTDADLSASVSDASRALYKQSWYEVLGGSDTAISTAYPTSPDLVLESLFTESATAATTEAERQFNLRSVKRDRFEFLAPMNADTLAVDLGAYVRIEHSRFGLSSGKNFAVITVEPLPLQGLIRFGVWG